MFDYEYWGINTLSIKENMALEEYMLNRSEQNKVATVRFWNVKKDSVVLSYGEDKNSNIKRIDSTFDLTRRITGGSHVEFDKNCMAYTFTTPRDGSFKHFDEMRKYYAERLVSALSDLGIDNIYADNKASTINVNDKVIASHAMFWGVKSALMHGLILIDHYDVDRIYARMRLNERKIGKHIYREYDALKEAPVAKEIIKLDGTYRSENEKLTYIKNKIADAILATVTEGRHSQKQITDSIVKEAKSLVEKTHAGPLWLDEREPTYTEEKVEAIPGEELAGPLKRELGYCMYIAVDNKAFKKMALPADEKNQV
ncbi:MAG: hypothetical protein QXR85_01075 [Candidatus Micrarchaeaceae archaeon]